VRDARSRGLGSANDIHALDHAERLTNRFGDRQTHQFAPRIGLDLAAERNVETLRRKQRAEQQTGLRAEVG
jgi:hypothetical protein